MGFRFRGEFGLHSPSLLLTPSSSTYKVLVTMISILSWVFPVLLFTLLQ